jgi:hypothetical protein
MQLPIIHLGGTSASSLLEDYCDATQAVRAAIAAVQHCAAPNARDYYVSRTPGAYQIAVEEHGERLEKLNSVLKELETIAEHVADAESR